MEGCEAHVRVLAIDDKGRLGDDSEPLAALHHELNRVVGELTGVGQNWNVIEAVVRDDYSFGKQ